MKKYLIIVLLLLAVPCWGADSKISELTENSSPTTDDLLATVDDPSGTPTTKKATIGNVVKTVINDSAGNGDTSATWSADKIYDTLSLKQDTPTHSANCVVGYNGSDVYGCYTEWSVGNVLTNQSMSTDGDITVNTSTDKLQYYSNGATHTALRESDHVHTREVGIVINGGGSAITTGVMGDRFFDHAATITKVTMLADQTGSCVIDIWKDTYDNYPPTVADTITASAKPTLSSAIKSQDSTLTGWTKSISAGDILRFNVDSCSTITRLILILTITE